MKLVKKDIFLFGLLYLISHAGIFLISNAIYWDDWILFQGKQRDIIEQFIEQAGTLFYLEGYMHVAMLKVGPWIYRALTFILMFGSGLCLNSILKRYSNILDRTRIFIVLLFLLLPFNVARVALSDFRYTLCYFLFFVAWLLIDRFRVLSLALFFLSFNTNSLLVFYAVPFFDMLYRSGHLTSVKKVLNFGIRKIDFVILPFIYFFVKLHFFAPSGLYEGYNQNYQINNLITSPIYQFGDFTRVNINLVLFFFFTFFVLYILNKKPLIDFEPKSSSKLIGAGLVLFAIGAFPYWILGCVPTFFEWTSRNQLLLPLGTSIAIVGIISVYAHKKVVNIIMSMVIGFSITFNVTAYAHLLVDWDKQLQLIQLFSKNPEIEKAGLIIFEDNTKQLNALKRGYRLYEWNGLLKSSFNNEYRFGIEQTNLNDFLSGSLDKLFSSRYLAGSFAKKSGRPTIRVKINTVVPTIGLKEAIANLAFRKITLSISQQ